MDYEHQPTRGPGAWIGAGALSVVGGMALVWVATVEPGGLMLAIGGWVLVGLGVVTVSAAAWWARRNRG